MTINDLEDIDQDLTKSLYYLLENNAEEISTNYIYTYQDFNGSPITCELVPGGFNIDITDENKHQYIKDFCEKRMFKDVKPQLDAFCRGFRSILPLRMINIFCPQDLQLMISGVGKIDVTEMLSHLTLEDSNSYDNSEQFIWLTEILSEYSQEKLSLFLQFITGKISF